LAPSLKAITCLYNLDINYNDFRAKGAAAPAPSLRVLTGLTNLTIGSNSFVGEGDASLAGDHHDDD
jgi:hypothetical protein